MQRRVAAIYLVFFLVVGAGAYTYVAVAQPPELSISGETYNTGESLTVNGRTYTLANISAKTSGGGGHGGGGGDTTLTGKLTWTNESARFTATLENNTTTTYQNDTYRVIVTNAPDPSSFTLREEQNVTAILRDDPAVENQTVTRADGRRYVVYEANGSTKLLSEYLPEPETKRFSEGDTLPYDGNQTTVSETTNTSITVQWEYPKKNTVELTNGENVTLNGETFVAVFKGENAVMLSPNVKAYQQYLDRLDYYHERIAGLWGIVILSGIAAVLILGLAYMPHRG